MIFQHSLAVAFVILAASLTGHAAGTETFIPANPPGMKRLAVPNSQAYQAIKHFQRGINLGDYLEAPGTGWGVVITRNDFHQMRAEGFDHVRIPVAWHNHVGPGPDFNLSTNIFGRVDFIVTNALANGLAVIVNIHHFNELDNDPVASTEKFLVLWRQIAAHYASFPDALAFEFHNEPHEKATTALMNPIYARGIAEVRKTNPRRTLFVEPGDWGKISELKNLELPVTDENIIVSVHCYEPFHFTHQGASWSGPDVKVKGIRFPGPPATPLVPDPALQLNPWVIEWIAQYNSLPAEKNPSGPAAFRDQLKLARAWSDYYGRPIHVGEFGCYVSADPESRIRFLTAFRQALDEQKLGWAMWDWCANFRYWDKKQNQAVPGIHQALFGK